MSIIEFPDISKNHRHHRQLQKVQLIKFLREDKALSKVGVGS